MIVMIFIRMAYAKGAVWHKNPVSRTPPTNKSLAWTATLGSPAGWQPQIF